jgi:prepilin-type N-terminal cleavage/methylation domain-containing protein
MNTVRKRGFTLIEALVATVIVGIGVVGTMAGFSVISRTEVRLHESELMQRLAHEKLDELIATGEATQSGQTGDFSDRNLTGYTWSLTTQSTSVTNLNGIVLTVTKGDGQDAAKVTATTLLYVHPTTTTGGAS